MKSSIQPKVERVLYWSLMALTFAMIVVGFFGSFLALVAFHEKMGP